MDATLGTSTPESRGVDCCWRGGENEQRGYAKAGTPVSTLVMAFRDAGCWGWHEGQHAISETPVSGSGERRGLTGL